jgi:hydrogenase-1 operon protein HyaF
VRTPDLSSRRIRSASGNVELLLNEIFHALQRLAQGGKGTSIDLGSLPFGPGEEQQLVEFLGEGEVAADVRVLGHSAVYETRLPGVWLITHYNADDMVIARLIEVTNVPEILLAQPQDMKRGIHSLEQRLGVTGRQSNA